RTTQAPPALGEGLIKPLKPTPQPDHPAYEQHPVPTLALESPPLSARPRRHHGPAAARCHAPPARRDRSRQAASQRFRLHSEWREWHELAGRQIGARLRVLTLAQAT